MTAPTVAPAWLVLPEEGNPSGSLRSSGPVVGAVHLVDGRIAAAESSAVPSLGERLVRSGLVADEAWAAAADAADLVRSGAVSPAELRDVLESVALDALVALRHSDLRWTAGSERVAEDLGWSRAEAADRVAAVVEALPALRGDSVVASRTPAGAVAVSREGWALAARVVDPTSVLALAREAGVALYEALVEVDRLLRAEVLVELALSEPALPEPVLPDPAPPAPRAPAALPRRRPGTVLEIDPALSGIPAHDPEGRPFETPGPEILQRLLDLLRAV